MDNRLQNWAPYLGALGVALIVGAIFLQVVFAPPAAVMMGLGAVGILLIALYVLTRPRQQLRETVTGRGTLHGSNALVLSIAFIIVVALIYYIVGRQFPGVRLDLTQNQSRTLSEQTVNVLKNLKDPIKVTGFFTPQAISSEMDAETKLKDYQAVSNKITYQFIDPQSNPAAAKNYDIVQDGTLVFERGARKEKIYQFDENSFTNAILKVSQDQQPAVYFITGHGELDPNDTGQTGLSSVTTYLQQTNYKVDKLNLASSTVTNTTTSGIPADASAIIIARPTKAFAPEDEQRLKQYLQNGGRILIMVDPQVQAASTDLGLKDLLNAWGLNLNNDLILDPAQGHNYRGIAPYPAMIDFPSHPVTQDLAQYGVFFPGARSIGTVTGTDKTPTALFTTSDQACGKTDLASLQNEQQLQCDPAKDEKGPFVLGYAVEGTAPANSKSTPRLIVVGNSAFASNQVLQSADGQGNGLLITNMVNWLAGQEDLIAIPAKQAASHPLTVVTGTDQAFIMVSNVALIPLTILIIGGLMWWRRR